MGCLQSSNNALGDVARNVSHSNINHNKLADETVDAKCHGR